MEAPAITLGDLKPATLVEPSPLAALAVMIGDDERKASDSTIHAAYGAAALFMCWPETHAWPTKPRPRPWAVSIPAKDYGHAIFDSLARARIMPFNDLIVICMDALNFATSTVLSEAEVQEAGKSSGAQAAPTSPKSSESAESTVSPSPGGATLTEQIRPSITPTSTDDVRL